MLSNLLGNAAKFTAQGSIRIEGSEVECSGDDVLLEFSVTDTGIGIAQDKLERLFKPFSQVDGSVTRQYGGSGLGLSIVAKLAQLMGGEVGVDSQPGLGSRFWFRVHMTPAPVEEDSRRSERALSVVTPALDAAPGGSGFVLVVEDNPINRMVIGGLLKKLGVPVENAENGLEAVALITAGARPLLVFMDCQMPLMDGFSATEAIRSWEAQNGKKRLAIVALTAGAFDEDRERCLAAGMDDFLAKPLRLPDLELALARWITNGDAERPSTPSGPESGDEEPATAGASVVVDGEPVMDMAIALDLVDGDLPTLLMMLPIVAGQITVDRQEIAGAIGAGNAFRLKTASHRLKGSVGQIGALRARGLCALLESAAAGGEHDGLVELQRGLEAELDALSAAIAEFLIKQPGDGT